MPRRRNPVRFPSTVLIVLGALLLVGCPRLPNDFEALSLEEKVGAYEQYLNRRGHRHEIARGYIAWHGWAAADLMAQYVSGQEEGLPIYEAIVIIRYVQWRGCSLRGSAAEQALEVFLENGRGDSLERRAAAGALQSIQDDVDFSDLGDDYPAGGPCQEGNAAPEAAP
jgi:hypothetical protein